MQNENTNLMQLKDIIALSIKNLTDGVNRTDNTICVIPDNHTIHSLEKHMSGRFRFRGTMDTKSTSDFAEYVKANSTKDESACFIDQKSMSASAVLNIGTVNKPGHADHIAKITLDKTAAYRAMLEITDQKLKQKTLAEFIEEYSDNITAIDQEGQVMTPAAAAAAVRRITIKAARDVESDSQQFAETRSALEKIEAKSQGAMPAFLTFKCIPYHGIPDRNFIMRLSILTSNDEPLLVLKTLKLEEHEEQMAEEFKELITLNLSGSGVDIYLGKFNS